MRRLTALMEYGCLADFGVGAGGTAGSHAGVGFIGPFTTIAKALGSQNADAIGQAAISALQQAGSEIASGGGRCRVARVPDTGGSCPCKGGSCALPRGGKRGPTKFASFAAGTLVLSREGLKPIEDLRVGELVAAIDPNTGAQRWRPVTARMTREAPAVMRLTLKDEAGRIETVVVTPNHPYLRAANDNGPGILNLVQLDPGGLWTAAGFLKAGDRVPSANGGLLDVVTAEVDRRPTRVYNLEVAADRTYAAGELQAWVHNASHRPPAAVIRGIPGNPNYPAHIRGWYANELMKRPPCRARNPPGYDWGRNPNSAGAPPRLEMARDNRSRGGRFKR